MVKVKIIKANDFSFSEKNAIYKAILKNKKERIEGDIDVNFINEVMEVNFKRRLSYYEKIAVLKEIFYEFCLNDIKFFRTSVNIPVEVFTFIDRNEENKQELSIIKEILNYNISEFNQNKNREKIISNIKISYDLIKKEIENGNKEILLNQLFGLTYKEVKIYYHMLNRILTSEKCNGVLIEMPNLDDLANPYCDIHLRWRRFKYLVEKKH